MSSVYPNYDGATSVTGGVNLRSHGAERCLSSLVPDVQLCEEGKQEEDAVSMQVEQETP